MLIDWFTVAAQVVNFLILVWLLKRFLYKPILHAIDAREQRIAQTLADADEEKAQAQRERDEFERKNEAFDQQRTALLRQAGNEAETERQRLMDEAREAATALRLEQLETLRNELQRLRQAISSRTQEEVFAIARKVLMDLASTSLEERMSAEFTRRLQALDGEAKRAFAEDLKTASGRGLVRSAFDLPEPQRTLIKKAVNETFAIEPQIHFETAPDIIGGIEISTNGRKFAWTIADHLASMQQTIAELSIQTSNAQDATRARAKSPIETTTRGQAP